MLALGAAAPARAQKASVIGDVRRVKDPSSLTGLEKKHAPVIRVPDNIRPNVPFEVRVEVGQEIHPMSSSHYIDFIELYLGTEPAGRLELEAAFNEPVATFALRLEKPATLSVRQYCNLHGLWESTVELTPS